jgi:hypothetical protein
LVLSNQRAPEGHIWVCAACGKTSRYSYGFGPKGSRDAETSLGWDESCAMNAVLVREADIEERTASGRVRGIRQGAPLVHWRDYHPEAS